MTCKDNNATKRKDRSDCLEMEPGRRWSEQSGTAWLAGEAIRYLNGADPADERRYTQAIALLRERQDGTDVLAQLAHETAEDPCLRWNVLHVLGDAGDAAAAGHLAKAALEALPDRAQQKGCEGPYDTELLNRTMAVIAIAAVAQRHKDAAEVLLEIIRARPARPVLVEAAKAAGDLGLQERVRELLQEEDRWILDIKRVSHRELSADPERKDGTEVGFVPPRERELHTAPSTCSCHCAREN